MALHWSPPVEPSGEEKRLIEKHCKKAKLFVFLRLHRHELFDEAFQKELAAMYPARSAGREVVAPALLAMVTVLQAALGVSDEDAVEFAAVEKRWQMLLGTLGEEDAPFSQGVLFSFRQRLIAHDMDRRLLERSVDLARKTGGFGHKALRAAFDASPLFGAGRVEDTFNLIGHAVREIVRTVAKRRGVDVEEAAKVAGVPLVVGSSLKAALDIDWDDPSQKKAALARLLDQVRSLVAFLEREMAEELATPPLSEQVATLRQIMGQDLEPDPDGTGQRIKRGVARERRISIRDGEMRHGRKSRASRVDGYKRHVAVDLAAKLVVAVAVTPANRPEAEATGHLLADVKRQSFTVAALHVDRGYLGAPEIEAERGAGAEVHCKPFPLHNAGRFTKADFAIDPAAKTITCPAEQSMPFRPGATIHFPAATCAKCPLRTGCTTSLTAGRSVTIHPQEPFFLELRRAQKTHEGRRELRRRIPVEHSLAHVGRSQGRRARYVGVRKNLFDLRRHAVVENLHAANRFAEAA